MLVPSNLHKIVAKHVSHKNEEREVVHLARWIGQVGYLTEWIWVKRVILLQVRLTLKTIVMINTNIGVQKSIHHLII